VKSKVVFFVQMPHHEGSEAVWRQNSIHSYPHTRWEVSGQLRALVSLPAWKDSRISTEQEVRCVQQPVLMCKRKENSTFTANVIPVFSTIPNKIKYNKLGNLREVSLFSIKVKAKVKFTLEQTTKAQRRSRGIALLFL